MQAGGREGQTVIRAIQPRAIGDGRHFNGSLGAVGEGIVHFWIEVALGHFLVRPAEITPDRVRRRITVTRLEIHALAGGNDLETGGARPIDQLADQRRLVAISHGVNQALGPGLFGKDRPDHDIGFDINHDDMFVVLDGAQCMARASQRMAGGLDHAFDLTAGEKLIHIVGHIGLAALQRLAAALRIVTLLRPADAIQRFLRLADIEVCDGDHVETGDALRLRQHHGAELAGTDETNPNRLAAGCTR